MAHETATAVRLTASAELMSQAENLADMAEGLAVRTEGRLAGVMLPELAAGDTLKDAPREEIPKYFNDLRARLVRIERSLLTIDRCIVRTEL